MKKAVWIAVCLVLAGGVVFTYRDYRTWYAQETARFGQGNVAEIGLAAPKTLALPYSAFVGRFRLKPPVGWTVTENLTLKKMDPYPILPSQNLVEIVRFQSPDSTAQVVISAQATTDDLLGLINAQAVGITRDREYLTVGDTPITVLTWDKPEQVIQKALLSANENFIVIEVSTSAIAWKTWTKTFDAIYRSWTRI